MQHSSNDLFRLLPETAGKLITLENDRLQLQLAPECGARIVSFTDGGRHVLRQAGSQALATGDVYGFAGFPLVPYSGPIFGDGFHYRGAFHELRRNVRHEPTATHGEGWIRNWSITAQTTDACSLSYSHHAGSGTFPFKYYAQLRYSLEQSALVISVIVINRDHRVMPAGIGFHPYFPCEKSTVLQFQSTGVWPPDAPENVTLGCGPLEPGLDFSSGLNASPLVVDRCFEGWDGEAMIRQPDGYEVKLSADGALTRLQIYDPCDYPYLCVEPVSNANDGFNRLAKGVDLHGVAELQPQEALVGSLRLDLPHFDHRVIG